MPGRRWRRFSSDEILTALQRAGFEIAHTKGSHCSLVRAHADGRKDTTVVVLGQNPVPEGTFRYILTLAHMEYEEFLVWARVKSK